MTRTRLRLVAALALVFAGHGCERRRMHHDQQIGLLSECEQARRDSLAAASDAEREAAISRWVSAVTEAKGLCANDLHDALVMRDERSHLVALQVMKRLPWREHTDALLADLDSARLSPEQRARAAAALKALTGQDFGTDRAAWDAWLRSRP